MNAETQPFQKVKAYEEPDIDDAIAKRVAAWWWGEPDEDIAGHLTTAQLIAPSHIWKDIYMARIAEDKTNFRRIKDWSYQQAVEFVGAKGSGQRKRSMVESYRRDWGHQAARDGVGRVILPWETHPGRNVQAARFGVGHQAYQRVRDEVMGRALEAFVGFMFDLRCIVQGRWTREMIERWEAATGGDWDKAAK